MDGQATFEGLTQSFRNPAGCGDVRERSGKAIACASLDSNAMECDLDVREALRGASDGGRPAVSRA